ncbi:MAG: hypothetical protein ACJAUY_001016 [Cognaticolwellia sp.]|jgi:hypothetical protein
MLKQFKALYNAKFDIISVAINTKIEIALKRAQEYRVISLNLQCTGQVY